MSNTKNKKKIFCITEGTIGILTREMDLPENKLTPELMERIKNVIWMEFRDWDNWLKEIIDNLVTEEE